MPEKLPREKTVDHLIECGFRIGSYSQTGILFEHPDGRLWYVFTYGAFVVSAVAIKNGFPIPMPLRQLEVPR